MQVMNTQFEGKTGYINKKQAETIAKRLNNEGYVTKLAKKREGDGLMFVKASKIIEIGVEYNDSNF